MRAARYTVPRWAGLDQSLNHTGIAACYGGTIQVVRAFTNPLELRGVARLRYQRDSICDFVDRHNIDAVFMEGYSYGVRFQAGRVFELGELGGVLRLSLSEMGVAIYVVAPATNKKFVTGSGKTKGARKEAMLAGVLERWGYDAGGDDNKADAYGLAMLGELYLREVPYRTKQDQAIIKAVQQLEPLEV